MLRTIGALDAILSILGLYLLLDPIWRGLLALNTSADAPYFKIVFVIMLITNSMLLALFVLAAVQLLRSKRSGVTAHATASALFVTYDLSIRAFWAAGGRVGMSVAAATGIGTLGIAPFQCFNLAPYVYPIASAALFLIALWRISATLPTSTANVR